MSSFIPMSRLGQRGGRGQRYHMGSGRGRGRGRGRGQRRDYRGNRGRGRFQENRGPLERADTVIEEIGQRQENSLCVAVEGCCHGQLDAIYERLKRYEEESGRKVDLLLCCGDFQSLRNIKDFHSYAAPPKYRELGSFCRYYSGEKTAPILTIFTGGNHEASQALQELCYGGWVAPNIYYTGAAGVVNLSGASIGAISGIYKCHDYTKGQYERPPYDPSSLRSVYHVRNVDVHRLKCLRRDRRLDVVISHDWPLGIEQYGDTQSLLLKKPFFREEIRQNALGSPANRELLDELKPRWWFASHLHVKFQATVQHSATNTHLDGNQVTGLVPSQVTQAASVDTTGTRDANAKTGAKVGCSTNFVAPETSESCGGPDLTDLMTRFLSLDKCLPRRQYLSIVNVPVEERNANMSLEYDVEWLAILRKTHHLTVTERRSIRVSDEPSPVTDEELEWVRKKLYSRSNESGLYIPENFYATVHSYNDPSCAQMGSPYPMMGNPQTDELLELLELNHIRTIPYIPAASETKEEDLQQDENEIEIDGLSDADDAPKVSAADPAEIDIDDDARDVSEGNKAAPEEAVAECSSKRPRFSASVAPQEEATDINPPS